ncbi:hypothetical protein B0A55_01040 [Friedmanniomyces simplex]|uniref:NmrA-like domain-containing protein n=1 Tax=Friedmanniomyces simplex TaxID=329884 RepID=A0A4U0XZA2_9PEZI|nr:hypothetical protein B0A55_01040 [Friedmanniomyces simplex]
MSPILVITCPSGKQSSHLIPLLYNKSTYTLRLAAHTQASATKLRTQYPSAEVLSTDLANLTDCLALLKGATAIYAVLPSLHSREKEMGFNLVDAAVADSQRPGNVFEHFVLSSVLSTQHRGLMQHDLKSYVEERLFLSPLNWTVLKPTNFISYPVARLAAQEKPVMEKLWSPDVASSLIALADLAAASEVVLREREKHYLAEYQLCSTMPVSDREVCEEIGRQIGKSIDIRTPTFETGVNNLLGYLYGGKGLEVYVDAAPAEFRLAAQGDLRGDLVRDEAERLVLFYGRRGLVGSPNILRWLLGREPMTVAEWVKKKLDGVGVE